MPTPISQIESKDTLGALTPRATSLASRGLKTAWDERIKAHSVFSARTTSQRYLDALKKTLAEVASRQLTPQVAEAKLRETLRDLGYRPETGFADAQGRVPPAKPGDIRDLSSSRRIQLIIDTNVKQARSLGQIAASEDPWQLMLDPAWQLTRTGARKKPRGDWRKRWAAAGAKVGWKGALKRDMIALKTSPIWQALADGTGGWRDTLGSPYPPFAFGSGLAWKNVSRSDWRDLCRREGVKDGLEEITAKAKELKAAQEAANTPQGASTPQGGATIPPGGGNAPQGIVEGLGSIAAEIARTPPEPQGENPLVEEPTAPPPPSAATPVGDLFKPDFSKRNAVWTAREKAYATVKAMRDQALAAVGEVDAAQQWAKDTAGAHPDAASKRMIAILAKRRKTADAALQELEVALGTLVKLVTAIMSTPIPRDAAEQRDFDAAMDRYAYSIRRAASIAEPEAMRADMAARAARRAEERQGGGEAATPAEYRADMERKDAAERAIRKASAALVSMRDEMATRRRRLTMAENYLAQKKKGSPEVDATDAEAYLARLREASERSEALRQASLVQLSRLRRQVENEALPANRDAQAAFDGKMEAAKAVADALVDANRSDGLYWNETPGGERRPDASFATQLAIARTRINRAFSGRR